MRRAIAVETEDTEGLCYDPVIAEDKGLYEELTFVIVHEDLESPVLFSKFPPEVMEYFIHEFDLGVNVEPGIEQEITFKMRYVYDYGNVDPVSV